MTELFLDGRWLVGATLRSTIILLVVAIVVWVCRKSSAATLYRIWFLGLLGCLVQLPMGATLPRWNLSVLPTQTQAATSPSHPTEPKSHASLVPVNVKPRAAYATQKSPPVTLLAADAFSKPARDLSERLPLSEPESVVGDSSLSSPSWSSIAIIVWIVGLILVAVRYLWHWSAARTLRLSCRQCHDEVWLQLLAACANRLGVERSVSIAFHPGHVSPMVVGIARPQVLLPESALAWSTDRRQIVLMHELSHIQRNDLLTHLLAYTACAVYWFNPLVWVANRQLKRLREIACDDAVVMRTSQPGLYAEVLLSVALAQRSASAGGAIAMARTNNVKDRIVCILDSARHRNPLTRRGALVLAGIALVVSALVGTGNLTGRAQESKPPAAAEVQPSNSAKEQKSGSQSASQSDETKTLSVRVLDEDGDPISGANVRVSIWEAVRRDEYRRRAFKSDEKGVASFLVPKRLEIIRYWVRMPNYTPMYIGFEKGSHDEGERVPPVYEFRLPKGHQLSGRVVDQDGMPIEGAKVDVDFEHQDDYYGPDPKPNFATLAEDESAAVTDANGTWQITNAPGPHVYEGEFRLKIHHPQYAGDSELGELQKHQGVTTQQLRDGTAVIKLSAGASLTGTVSDGQGNHVDKGLVTWSLDSSLDGFNKVVRIDADGTYQTPRLGAGSYTITVVVPGFAPYQQKIDLRDNQQRFDVKLSAGHPVKLRIVDQSGQPIPNVGIGIDRWRDCQTLYSFKHPDVIDSGIPSMSDANGMFVWDWAPEDEIKYYVDKKGYERIETKILPSSDVREVRLTSQPIIYGKVTDKATGKPVQRFRVTQVRDGWTSFLNYQFVDSVDGEFRYQIDGAGYKHSKNQVRIEADGYRAALGTKTIAIGEEPVQENFELESAPATVGRVKDQHGYPVTEFEVAISTPTSSAHFTGNKATDGMHQVIKGADQFELPASFEPSFIRVFNSAGFAEVVCEPDGPMPEIRLRPWSSLKGRLMQGDRPMAGEMVSFWPDGDGQHTGTSFQDRHHFTTDANGYFHFDKLPPVAGHVEGYLGTWEDSQMTSSESTPVQLEPGKTTEVVLSGAGGRVSGRVVATGRNNDEFSKQWSINFLVRRDTDSRVSEVAHTAVGFDPAAPMQPYWTQQKGFNQWLDARQNHFVKLNKQGEFLIQGVEPGQYELLVQLYEQPSGCLVETVGAKVVPITITPAQVLAGTIELGDIEIFCQQGPQVGTNMRAFEYKDVHGIDHYVVDLQCDYVVFHFWASWCAPCRESMPSIVDTQRKYSNDHVAFIGFNVDKDQKDGQMMADSFAMKWAQNYVGAKSDIAQQLAISSIPSYYLIGPDGMLVGSSQEWTQIKELLETQLKR